MPARFRADPLTREEIIEAALEITRTRGLQAVTMRAMAAELDVTPNALYYYFEDKIQLLTFIAEEVTSKFPALEVGKDGWEPALRRYLLSMWEALAQLPGLGAHMMEQPNLGFTRESVAEGTRFFEDAGFPRREARLAWSFALTYIHGRLSVDTHLGLDRPNDPPQRLRAHEYVKYGVDTLIAGLQTRLAAHGRTPAKR